MKFFRARKDFDVTICFTCRVCLNTQVQITKSGHRNEFASRSWHLMSGSGFVRNCKLQQVQMFGRSKNLLILQSCSWNMIVAPCQMCWIPRQKWSITSNLKRFRHMSFSIPNVCTLAIGRKHSKPRFCVEGWNKVILRTESKRVVVLH